MTLHARDITDEQIADLRNRHPLAFSRTLRQRALLVLALTALGVLIAYGVMRFDISFARIWNGLDRLGYIAAGLVPPSAGGAFWELFLALLESIAMAFLGTLIAAVIAVPLGLMGARNVLPAWLIRFSFRRSFDFLRGVDSLVWALVYVRAFGLGPLAGVLAIATSDIGTLSKADREALALCANRRTICSCDISHLRSSSPDAAPTARINRPESHRRRVAATVGGRDPAVELTRTSLQPVAASRLR